jgi:proteic killer suppression protein
MQKSLNKKMARKLKRRMAELNAAEVLADISHLPPPRLHELKNRNGVFSVNLEHPKRLLFISANDPIPRKGDGGIDLHLVDEIEVIAIEDTHDAKNKRKKRG